MRQKWEKSIPDKNKYTVNVMRTLPCGTLEPHSYDIAMRMGLFINTRLKGIEL